MNPAEKLHLSKRQAEVLELAWLGLPDKQIAGELKMSVRTVRAHWTMLFHKLNAPSRVPCILAWERALVRNDNCRKRQVADSGR